MQRMPGGLTEKRVCDILKKTLCRDVVIRGIENRNLRKKKMKFDVKKLERTRKPGGDRILCH